MSKPRALTAAELKRHPLPPVAGGDKDTHGQILIIGGSREVPGAALLAAHGAMRAGAGKLQVATVNSVAPTLGVAMPEAMVVGLAEQRDGGFAGSAVSRVANLAADVDAVVAGPGVKLGQPCERIASALLATNAALVFDAAMLIALPERDRRPAGAPMPLLLPHLGELAGLLECDEDEVEADPVGCGSRAASIYRSLVLVKGVESHVVSPDGATWKYRGGGPGLGVSGSGDTLAGITGGLLARGADPLTALLWAVWLHGEAGRRLSRKVGPTGFLAREIPDEVPALLPR